VCDFLVLYSIIAIYSFFEYLYFLNGHIFKYHIFKNLYNILLFFTIFKIVNTDKIYFLKLYLDSLENMGQN
jgi:hypothetical protein